ncbi:MAG TPA: hypothetical protein VHO25_06545, partial [Polyangiaceae bacterium]|nr:hypothetical protein [Polyangiaceae bacterium]
VLLGALAGAAFLQVRKPRFRSETVILYVEQGSPIETNEGGGAPRNITVRLKELLLSRPKLERIVSDFNLYPKVRDKYGPLEAVEELKRHVDFRAPGGDTFSIAFEGGSPSEAQQVTAELARVVLQGDSELRTEQARVTLDFLKSEKQRTDSELRDAEQKLAAFMAKHPRFALDTTPLTNGAAIRASMGAAAGTTASNPLSWSRSRPVRSLASKAQAGANEAGVTPDNPLPIVTEDLDPVRARAALAAARANLAEQLTHYTPAHPDVRAAQSAVARAEQRLETAERSAPVPLPAPAPTPVVAPVPPSEAATTATPTVAATERGTQPRPAGAPIAAAAAGGTDVVATETEWLNLTRAVTEARQRHDQVQTQLFKADILASSEGGGHGVQVNVIDPAYLPLRPLPPGRLVILLMFLAGSFVIGAVIAVARATMDERLLRGTDLEGIAEILVEIPKASAARRAHGTT